MSHWTKVEKKLPNDDRQVLALVDSCAYLASFRDGDWYMSYTAKLGGVTRWMEIPGEPKDFAYWFKRLRGWLDWQVVTAKETNDRFSGWATRTAQLGKKPVFYRDASGKILSGMPENIPAPQGYQKIVCGSVFEAERYSEMQRRQEHGEHRRTQEARCGIESSFQAEIRSEMVTKMLNARNNTNRDFMRRAIERVDARKDPTAYDRESYLHSEAYEKNH